MGDSYREILVKRITPTIDKVKKVALVVVTVLLYASGILLHPLFLLAGIVMTVVDVILFPRFDLEYEYLYVSGELVIDKIMGKQKRKRCGTYNLEQLDMLAPSNSHALDSYLARKDLKVHDYTSLDPNVRSYTMILNEEKGQVMLKLEIDEDVVNDIRRFSPRKVVLY